ncbi:hypothetical protein [Cystobacter fuscus]|uniref:hypothetical protein n=1 Tax=Cystobacter fuscus TaxID=43 RepID=UPI002B2A24B0|nr:hypothetical protein F0U63_43020 [Cystobacter fuscus]
MKSLPLWGLALCVSSTTAFAFEQTRLEQLRPIEDIEIYPDDPGGGGGGQVPPPPWTPSYYRCTQDQLNPDQGRGRQKWAQRWANNDPYNISASRDQRFWLSEHTEYAITAYESYSMWLYPVYVNPDNYYEPYPGPGAPSSSTAGYTGDQIFNLSYIYKPVSVVVDGICEPGCYMPDQKVLFQQGGVSIQEAQTRGISELVTLAAESTLGSIQLVQDTVERYTLDRDAASQEILHFRMESGGKLAVTLEHPLVTSEGRVKKARLFTPGDSLVKQDGSLDKIVSIDSRQWYGKVYNLRPSNRDFVSNILVAEGYLNGSGRFQSEFVEELNRILLRDNVPDEVVPSN